MKSKDSSYVRLSIDVPPELAARIVQIADSASLAPAQLILIWLEAQTSPGADVVLGKSHS